MDLGLLGGPKYRPQELAPMMIGPGSCGLFAAAELLAADANAETSWNPFRHIGDSHHLG